MIRKALIILMSFLMVGCVTFGQPKKKRSIGEVRDMTKESLDSKITALSADTSPDSADIGYTIDDPSGTPTSKKATWGNIITKAHGLSDGLPYISSSALASNTNVDLSAASGTTGTGSTNIVLSTSPTITTPTFVTSITMGSAGLDETELEILDGATLSTTQINYLNAATGTTGTTSSNLVFSASPTLTGTAVVENIDGSGTISGNLFTPDAADGADIGSTALEYSDIYVADGSVIYFGNDQDVTLTHNPDAGLILNLALTANSFSGNGNSLTGVNGTDNEWIGGTGWAALDGNSDAVTQNNLRDWGVLFDADGDGSLIDETWYLQVSVNKEVQDDTNFSFGNDDDVSFAWDSAAVRLELRDNTDDPIFWFDLANSSFNVKATSSPKNGLYDSDAAGAERADEYAGGIGANFTTTTEDAEVSDVVLYWMDAGTERAGLTIDGSAKTATFYSTLNVVSNFASILPQAYTVNTDVDSATVGSEITSGVVDITTDNDADSDEVDLQDGTAAFDGVFITFTCISGCDSDDTVSIDAEEDSTCTGCPYSGVFTFDSVGDSCTLRWNNTAGAWFYMGSYDAS